MWVISGGKLGIYYRLGTYSEREGNNVDKFTMLPGQLPYVNRSKLQAYDINTDSFGAPKSFNDTTGRRILFGSIGSPPCPGRPAGEGMQSLPRVVTLCPLGGGILTNPIPELAKLRTRRTVRTQAIPTATT